MPANLENSAVATKLEKVSFHSNPKEGQCYKIFKLPYNCTHFPCQQGYAQNPSSLASADFSELKASRCTSWVIKGRGTRAQTVNTLWIMEKGREFWKSIYFYMPSICVKHDKLWKILKRDWNTRLPYLSPEKLVYRSRTNNQNQTQNNGLVQNCERSMTRLYTVTLFNLYADTII